MKKLLVAALPIAHATSPDFLTLPKTPEDISSVRYCGQVTSAWISTWPDPTLCMHLSEECLATIAHISQCPSACINAISPVRLRKIGEWRAVQVLNEGVVEELGVEQLAVLVKSVLKSDGHRRVRVWQRLWARAELAHRLFMTLPIDLLVKLIRADTFTVAPPWIGAFISQQVLARLPPDFLAKAPAQLLPSLPPPAIRSLTAAHCARAHPRAFSQLTADHILMMPDPCIAAVPLAGIAGMVGARVDSDVKRFWRAANVGPPAARIMFAEWIRRHPCQALRTKRRLFKVDGMTVGLVDGQCALVWSLLDGKHASGRRSEGSKWRFHRFPLIASVVMGVILAALLIQACVVGVLDEYAQ